MVSEFIPTKEAIEVMLQSMNKDQLQVQKKKLGDDLVILGIYLFLLPVLFSF